MTLSLCPSESDGDQRLCFRRVPVDELSDRKLPGIRRFVFESRAAVGFSAFAMQMKKHMVKRRDGAFFEIRKTMPVAVQQSHGQCPLTNLQEFRSLQLEIGAERAQRMRDAIKFGEPTAPEPF